jgi:hypothetical protein
MPELDETVANYIKARDLLKQLDAAHDKKRKPLVEYQDKCAGVMREFMELNKLTSLPTKAGTCYLSTKSTASLADPQTFMDYVIASGQWHLLDRKANSTAVKDYVNEFNRLPPGCNLNTVQTVGVRSPTKKTD